jgi:hypothetical protein
LRSLEWYSLFLEVLLGHSSSLLFCLTVCVRFLLSFRNLKFNISEFPLFSKCLLFTGAFPFYISHSSLLVATYMRLYFRFMEIQKGVSTTLSVFWAFFNSMRKKRGFRDSISCYREVKLQFNPRVQGEIHSDVVHVILCTIKSLNCSNSIHFPRTYSIPIC